MEDYFAVKCPECGARNKLLQSPKPGKIYRCGKCGAVITFPHSTGTQGSSDRVSEKRPRLKSQSHAKKWLQSLKTGNTFRLLGYGLIAFGILVVLIIVFTLPSHKSPEIPPTPTQTTNKKPVQSPDQIPEPAQAIPAIAFDPAVLNFTVSEGKFDILNGALNISNSGGGTLNWTASSGFYNITLSPASGSSNGETDKVNVSINIEGLSAGDYEAAISIYAEDAAQVYENVPIKISIIKNPAYVYENGNIHIGGDGEPVELINNPGATNPTYAELAAFIDADTTDALPYIREGPEANISADIAERVHNNAEENGIRAAWVNIDLEDSNDSYALNAFETTDMGLIYIDCTGYNRKVLYNIKDVLQSVTMFTEDQWYYMRSDYPSTLKSWDTVAYVEKDKEYGRIGIKCVKAFSYDFFEENTRKWEEFKKTVSEYNEEVTLFNEAVAGTDYEVESQELAVMEAREIRIIQKRQSIDKLAEELGYIRLLPLGKVKDIFMHW